jgi:glycosyltransferase involved in cell wall biosynthesis
VTNSAGNLQCISLPELAGANWRQTAKRYTEANLQRIRPCRGLGFFCVAVRRGVLDEIGLLDEDFGLGMFEDDDLCLRVRKAGYDIVMTDACFVRHAGSASFAKLDASFRNSVFEANRRLFCRKHACQWTFSAIAQDIWKALLEDIKYADKFPVGTNEHVMVSTARSAFLEKNLRFMSNNELSLHENIARLENNAISFAAGSPVLNLACKIYRKYRKDKISGLIKAVCRHTLAKAYKRPSSAWVSSRLLNLTSCGRSRIFLPPIISWDLHLFQRPQHLARELAALGYLYMYADPAGAGIFKRKGKNLYITPDLSTHIRPNAGDILHLYSTRNSDQKELISRWEKQGGHILYEYVDEMHPDISGMPIKQCVYDKHRRLLGDKKVFVAATASRLYDECLSARGSAENLIFCPNAAEVEHFAQARGNGKLPAAMGAVAKTGKKIIGYFGALSTWFDYELVRRIALNMPECEIVILGLFIGRQKTNWENIPNIRYLGKIPYKDLPDYAKYFDVGIIPFKVNEITLSTSPIKLFEYMALGLETVTADLPECRKYPHTLAAKNYDEFMACLGAALERSGSAALREQITGHARENHSWAARAKEIDALLRNRKNSREKFNESVL